MTNQELIELLKSLEYRIVMSKFDSSGHHIEVAISTIKEELKRLENDTTLRSS